MDEIKQFLENNPSVKYCVAGAATLLSVFLGWNKLSSRKKLPKIQVPDGTVVLHSLPRGPFAPNLSPFPMKLEMFLRLAGIPYVTDFTQPMSAKGKTPWMTFNGSDIADSQICIMHLKELLGVDTDKNLTAEQKAVARAIQVLVDEHMYWTLVYFRWIHDPELAILQYVGVPRMAIWFLKRTLRAQLYGQGMGRHTTGEIYNFLLDDLTTLQNFLGTKKFMMGDDVTEVDCSVFGMLSQLVFHQQDAVMGDLVKNKFPTLQDYVERVKSTMWPDWEEVTSQGSKFKK